MRFTKIDVNEKVNLFNKTIKNIRNYISHETIAYKDIRELIHEKNQAYIVKIKTTYSLSISSNFFNLS